MRTYKYVIHGDPTELTHVPNRHEPEYTARKEVKLLQSISLQTQQDNRPQFNEPINVSFLFCFNKNHRNLHHMSYPNLYLLIANYTLLAKGILWRTDKIIVKTIARKVYGEENYIQITVSNAK